MYLTCGRRLREICFLAVFALSAAPAEEEACAGEEAADTADAMFSLLAHRVQKPEDMFARQEEHVQQPVRDRVHSGADLYQCGDDLKKSGKCVRFEELPDGRTRITITRAIRNSSLNIQLLVDTGTQHRNGSIQLHTINRSAFANVTKTVNTARITNAHGAEEIDTVEVVIIDIASPTEIIMVYIVLFGGLLLICIFCYAYFETTLSLYVGLLCLCVGASHVGFDLVNTSLGRVMQSPNAVTSFQAAFSMVVCGLWCLWRGEELLEGAWCKLLILCCSSAYALFQIVNHLFFTVSSLSQRVLYMNLSSPLVLGLELILLPSVLKPTVNRWSIIALIMVLSGVVVFCRESADFEVSGLLIGVLTSATYAGSKLFERGMLGTYLSLSIMMLAFVDNSIMTFAASALSFSSDDHLVASWTVWLHNRGVVVMLCLSMVVLCLVHLCALALLRVASTTMFVVVNNAAAVVNIVLGNLLFSDGAAASQFKLAGLLVNLIGGFWLSYELQLEHSRKHEEALQPKEALHPKVARAG